MGGVQLQEPSKRGVQRYNHVYKVLDDYAVSTSYLIFALAEYYCEYLCFSPIGVLFSTIIWTDQDPGKL